MSYALLLREPLAYYLLQTTLVAAKFFLSHNIQEDKVLSYANVYITMRDFVFQNLSMNCYSVCDVTQVIVT